MTGSVKSRTMATMIRGNRRVPPRGSGRTTFAACPKISNAETALIAKTKNPGGNMSE